MTRRPVDFGAVFRAQPTAYLVMDLDLVIVDANPAYLALLGRTRDELVGHPVFEVFPAAPETRDADGVDPLQRSFERARDTGRPDQLPLLRYQVRDVRSGALVSRTWSMISVPVLDDHGRTQLVLQRAEDVTDYLAARGGRDDDGPDGHWVRLEADLQARTLELRRALDHEEATARRLAATARVALQLTDAASVQDIIDVLAAEGLAALGADGGAIALRDEERGVVRLTLTPSLGPGAQRRFATIGLDSRLPAAWVARTGETLVHESQDAAEAWSPEMRESFEESGQRAWITVPLAARGRLLGSLLAGWARDRPFTADEIGQVQAFAVQCAQAIDRMQALDAERRTARTSRVLAEDLQRSMLTDPFQPDHCQIAVRYLPAMRSTQVGGDWYDAFLQADGALNLVIGDVVGHDVAAVTVMAQLRSVLRGISVTDDPSPARVLDLLDTAITQLGIDTHATVGMARFEQTDEQRARGTARLRWASAGHLSPVVVDGDGRLVDVPETVGRLMLGVDHTTVRLETVLELGRGSTVLMFTDGLVERRDRDLDAGVAALSTVVEECAGLTLEQLLDEVLRRLLPGRQDDDVALVALRLHPEDGPRPVEAGPSRLPGTLRATGP